MEATVRELLDLFVRWTHVIAGIMWIGNSLLFNWLDRNLRPVDNVQQLPLDKITIAQVLKKTGYATGMFGKWHLGNGGDYHPGKRGFDEAIVSMGAHFDFVTNPPVEYSKGQYLADFLADKAVDFIKRHKDGPFFLYLPHFAVHSPHHAKQELIDKFKPKPGVGGHNNPTYAAMIASVDESVGRVMALPLTRRRSSSSGRRHNSTSAGRSRPARGRHAESDEQRGNWLYGQTSWQMSQP